MWGIFVFIVFAVQQLRNAALPFRGIATAASRRFVYTLYSIVLRNEISKDSKLHETGLSGAVVISLSTPRFDVN